MCAPLMWAGEQKVSLRFRLGHSPNAISIFRDVTAKDYLMERALRIERPDKADDLPLDERGQLIARLLTYKPSRGGRSEKHPTGGMSGLLPRTGDKLQIMACLNALGITQRFLETRKKRGLFSQSIGDCARTKSPRRSHGMKTCTAMNVMENLLKPSRC